MTSLGDENASGASCNTLCVRDNGFCQSARLLQAGLHMKNSRMKAHELQIREMKPKGPNPSEYFVKLYL